MFRWIIKGIFKKSWKILFGKEINLDELDKNERLIDAAKNELEEEYGFHISKSFWNTFIDSLGRLPRPMFTFWVFYLLILPLWSRELFQDTMLAYAEIPSNISQIILVIIGFWFLSRGLEKMKGMVDATKYRKQLEEVGRLRAEIEIHRRFTNNIKDEDKPLSESAIKKWNEQYNKKSK